MTMREFCEKTGMKKETIRCVEQFMLDESVYLRYRQLFQEDQIQFFKQLKEEQNWRMLALVLYIRMAVEVYEKYKEKQIC